LHEVRFFYIIIYIKRIACKWESSNEGFNEKV